MTVLYLLQVYCIGNLLQQMCVRKVGAPVFATLICVRLLASVVGEPPFERLSCSRYLHDPVPLELTAVVAMPTAQ